MSERDIQKLLDAGIIDAQTAQNITTFLQKEDKGSGGLMLAIFASIGALLLGGGIILILAHNWDRMPEYARIIVACLPLLLAQFAAWYTLRYKEDSISWREASATVLFLAIGATIATLGQIFHLPSDIVSFMRVWIIAALPIMYLLKSNTAALLTYIWIFIFAVNDRSGDIRYWSWILLIAALPYYIHLMIKNPQSRVLFVFNWLVAILVAVSTLITFNNIEEFGFIVTAVLAALYYHIGKLFSSKSVKGIANSWNVLAHLATLVLCYVFTFKGMTEVMKIENLASFYYHWILIILPILYIIYSVWKNFTKEEVVEPPYHFWIIALNFYFIGFQNSFTYIFFNVVLLSYGIYYAYKGIKEQSLMVINVGLLTIIILIVTRFFDINISFLLRGLVFMALGIGFFLTNYLMIKRAKA